MFRCTKRSMTGLYVEFQFIASWGIILRLALIQHVFPFLHFQFHDEHFIYEIQSSQNTVSRLSTQVYLGCPSQYDQCRLAKIWVLHRSSFHLYAISCPVLPVIISTIHPDPRLKTILTLTPCSEPQTVPMDVFLKRNPKHRKYILSLPDNSRKPDLGSIQLLMSITRFPTSWKPPVQNDDQH